MNYRYFLLGGALGALSLFSSCSSLSIDSEAKAIIDSQYKIRKALNCDSKDAVQIYSSDKNSFEAVVYKESCVDYISYIDNDLDGKYDNKRTISIPKKLELIIPDFNSTSEKKIIPRKKDVNDIKGFLI